MIALWHSVTKKGNTFVEGFCRLGEIFEFMELVELVSRCFIMYLHFWLMMYSLFLFGLSMIGGDTLIVYVSCFTLLIDLYL